MKNIISYGLLAAGVGFLLTSCVSKKKYQQALYENQQLQRDSAALHQAWNERDRMYDSLHYAFEDFREEKEQTIVALLSQLDKKTADVMEKEGMLNERAEKLRQLQEQVQRKNQQMNELRSTLRKALVNIPSQDLQVEFRDGRIYINLSENLLFSSGSAHVDKKGRDALSSLAQVLKDNPDLFIDIVGHTDSIPIRTARFFDNWDLSAARATSIARILVDDYGVSGKNLKSSGRGEYNPLTGNQTSEGRAKNRRTEIILSPNLEILFQLADDTPISN